MDRIFVLRVVCLKWSSQSPSWVDRLETACSRRSEGGEGAQLVYTLWQTANPL